MTEIKDYIETKGDLENTEFTCPVIDVLDGARGCNFAAVVVVGVMPNKELSMAASVSTPKTLSLLRQAYTALSKGDVTRKIKVLAVLAALATPLTAQADTNLTWRVKIYGGPFNGTIICPAISSTTARGAVRNCLVRFGGAPPYATFQVTAKPVCRTTHVATTGSRTGYIYTTAFAHPGCA
jgi:hypothetical protein